MAVTAAELEEYLHEHIPLSCAMAVSVDSVERDRVVLRAPLQPNINHRETAFGGSMSALAILAAWSLLYTRLRTERVAVRLVIQRNTMDYEHPIAGEFTAIATLTAEVAWHKFVRTLASRRKARIAVGATLEHAGIVAGYFTGDFVALCARATQPVR
jgi:thioesterase domain-containing protein